MSISKLISIILIIGSIILAYTGCNKISENTTELNILGIKLETSNESAKKEGYLFLALAALTFIGGIYTLNKSNK